MAEIKKIKLGGTSYDVRDAGATRTTVMPNDSGEIKTKYRIATHGYTSGATWYFKVCNFPVNNNANYAGAIISGRIGGWVSNDMSYINALVWNRGTPSMSVIDIAGDASAMSSIWNTAELVLYTNSDNTATLYIKCYNYYAFDIDLELYQSSASITYDGTYITKTPSGTLNAKSSTSTRRMELINGELYVAGTQMSKSNHTHTLSVVPASNTDTSSITLTHGGKYQLNAGGNQTIFTIGGDSNTWRKIQLNGTDKLGTATSTKPLNFEAGSNMIITESNGTFRFAATNTWRGIQDNLNSTSTTESLSANQGKFLKAAIDGKAAYNHGHGNMDGSGCLSTASVVVITDTNKKISPSSITVTELGYLDGVTSNIQTQLNSKAASNHTHTTNSTFYLDDRNYVHATGFYAQSDKRLKENIKEFIPQKSILDLPVVEFDYIETKSHNIGCLAQDLQEICPEIVNETEEGYLSIEEDKLVYLLLLEVKKLKAETEILKNKLEKQSN